MNKRMIYALLIVLGALLAFWVILKNVGAPTSEPASLTALDIEFDAAKAARIDVYKQDYPDSGLHFVKVDTAWVLANAYNAPAKKADLDKLMSDLNNASGQIRGESAELYDNFDITDERALQIEIYDPEGSGLLHAYIGKGSGGRETFVRLAGSPTVYLANENFISRFAAWNAEPETKLPPSRWLELTLCDIPRDSTRSFTIQRGKTDFVFALTEEPAADSLAPPAKVWTQIAPEKGLRLDESKISRLHSSFANMRASDVADPANMEKHGLEDPEYSIRIMDNNGNSAYIKFGQPFGDKKDRYAIVEGRKAVYVVPSGTFDRIFEDQFKKPDK